MFPVVLMLLGAGPVSRPAVDTDAMREAMEASRLDDADEGYCPAAAYAHFLAARISHYEGDERAALGDLRQALATDEGDPYLITALAEQHARVGELTQAERLLRPLLVEQPRYYRGNLLMGRVLIETHKPLRAKTFLKRAASAKPD